MWEGACGGHMSSISVGELKSILKDIPDDTEVVMYLRHKYDIPKESGLKGWIAYINGIEHKEEYNEVRLMN